MPNDDLDRLVSDGGVVYAYDAAMSETRTDAYGYNIRNELTSATKLGGPASVPATPDYAYQYDDIGNRITSTDLGTNRTYTANSLNQYSAITTSDLGLQTSSFEPQFDADGNQTLIQTATGIWSVQYNGENRPILWTSGDNTISMSYDSNVWRFSSEYADADAGLVYYNYRHYEPVAGRWLSRDGIDEDDALLLFLFCRNSPLDRSDILGDSVTGYIDYASYGYFMEIGSRFNFDCFGECIEEWRLDWNAILEALGSSVIPVPKAMGEKLWIEDGVSENTTTLSRVISKVQRLARKLPLGSAARRKVIQVSGWLRRAARNPMVIAAGTASTAITIFEGYYDIGVMFYCCTTCFR